MTSADADLVQSLNRLDEGERAVVLEFLQSNPPNLEKLPKRFQILTGSKGKQSGQGNN